VPLLAVALEPIGSRRGANGICRRLPGSSRACSWQASDPLLIQASAQGHKPAGKHPRKPQKGLHCCFSLTVNDYVVSVAHS